MKRLLSVLGLLAFAAVLSAQAPLWDLAKDKIPAELNHGATVAADGSVALAGGPGAFALVDAGTGPSPRALGGIVPQDATAGSVIYAAGFGGYAGGTDDRLFNDVWLTAA